MFRTDDFSQVATIATGALPHGLWPSGDGSRVYVGLENADTAAVIDTASNTVIAEVPVGQGPQGVAYVPNAVPEGDGKQNSSRWEPPQDQRADARRFRWQAGDAGHPVRPGRAADAAGRGHGTAPEDALRAGARRRSEGSDRLEPLAAFMTNPAGAAIVNAIGPIRQVTRTDAGASRRYLVVVSGKPGELGSVVQMQTVD